MNILLADNDLPRASLYSKYLVENGHTVVLSHTGRDCLKIYRRISRRAHIRKPFDVVIIGDNTPDRKAVEIAKEIFSVNPHQRLILTSNNIVKTFYDTLRELNVSIEVLQYPVLSTMLVNRLKVWEFHDQLEKMTSKMKGFDKKHLSHKIHKKVKGIIKKETKTKKMLAIAR